jgi:hypothetical protein
LAVQRSSDTVHRPHLMQSHLMRKISSQEFVDAYDVGNR